MNSAEFGGRTRGMRVLRMCGEDGDDEENSDSCDGSALH
jgi:hypothetical protein